MDKLVRFRRTHYTVYIPKHTYIYIRFETSRFPPVFHSPAVQQLPPSPHLRDTRHWVYAATRQSKFKRPFYYTHTHIYIYCIVYTYVYSVHIILWIHHHGGWRARTVNHIYICIKYNGYNSFNKMNVNDLFRPARFAFNRPLNLQ